MNREVVTIDQMVNGDLIAIAEWPDPDAEYFVGISPVNPDRFAMVNEYGSLSYGTASAKWQRLTKSARDGMTLGSTVRVRTKDGKNRTDVVEEINSQAITLATPSGHDRGKFWWTHIISLEGVES